MEYEGYTQSVKEGNLSVNLRSGRLLGTYQGKVHGGLAGHYIKLVAIPARKGKAV